MPLVTASGFAGLEATPLARIGYSKYIVTQGWERDFLKEITNTKWDQEITRCNQIIQFTVEPNVGAWRPYERSQELVADEITPEAFTMEICRQAYKSVIFDDTDRERLCERFDEFENMYLDRIYKGLGDLWKCYTLNGMVLEAAVTNKGARAGRNCDINLGTVGAPRIVNSDNINELFSAARRVLVEQQRWEEGEMFAIITPAEEEMILNSPAYYDRGIQGDDGTPSSLITGQMPGMLAGFKIFVTNSLPTVSTIGGRVDNLIFGHRDAFAFAGDLVQSRIMPQPKSFTSAYQMLTVYDGKALIPNALAIAHVRPEYK